MINELQLDNSNIIFNQYKIIGSDTHKLTGLKKINIFVGANNSGKSRFLRELFNSFRSKEINNSDGFYHIDFPFIDLKKANEEFDLILKSYLKDTPSNELDAKKKHVNEFKDLIHDKIYKGKLSFNEYANVIREFSYKKSGIESEKLKTHNAKHDNLIKTKKEELQNITYSVFIPVLRSLKKILKEKTPLKSRIFYDYFEKLDFNKLNVFTGEELYNTIKKANVSGEDEIEKVKKFEEFLGNAFFKSAIKLNPREFLGKDDNKEDISNKNNDLYIKIGKEPEYSISNIGDGIQALIILTFQLFLHADKNLLLFIEEPELNLHPGLQRLFLETLNDSRFNNTQVIFTTHSNHFLDFAIETNSEMAIFSFKKKPIYKNKEKAQFEISDITKRSFDALNLLGVNSSSVFLSNCTIWVEGISDRLFIRKYLDIYQSTNPDEKEDFSKFKEDIHYSFVEYAGNNITHWSFLDIEDDNESINYLSISKNIFLITDKDRNKEYRHKVLEKKLGDNYFCLECLEIENLLTPKVLIETIKKYKKNNIKEISFKNFKLEDYYSKDIGEFIYSSVVIDEKQINKIASKPINGKPKKIINKYEFAKNAIDSILSWDDLSGDAHKLVRAIYQFILNNNKS